MVSNPVLRRTNPVLRRKNSTKTSFRNPLGVFDNPDVEESHIDQSNTAKDFALNDEIYQEMLGAKLASIRQHVNEIERESSSRKIQEENVATLSRLRQCSTRREMLIVLHEKNLHGQRRWIPFVYIKAYSEMKSLCEGNDYITEGNDHIKELKNMEEYILRKSQQKNWMECRGPVGELPVHLAFLFGLDELGRKMIKQAIENVKTEEQGKDEQEVRRRSCVNVTYENDLKVWFKETKEGDADHAICAFIRERFGDSTREEALLPISRLMDVASGKDGGMFTGESLLHIAIVQNLEESITWLLEQGADLLSRATGIFFQPYSIEELEIDRKLFSHNRQMNTLGGACHYGEFPLSFACSVASPRICHKIAGRAFKLLKQYEENKIEEANKEQVTELVDYLTTWHYENTDEHRSQNDKLDCKTLYSAFLNNRDHLGNTALHMAVQHGNIDAIRWLLDSSAEPSMCMLNQDNLTPLTLAVRRSQKEAFSVLRLRMQDLAWTYGQVAMVATPLFQIDSFRTSERSNSPDRSDDKAFQPVRSYLVRDKRMKIKVAASSLWEKLRPSRRVQAVPYSSCATYHLHNDPRWKSAVEVLVEHEIVSFAFVKIFRDLVDGKWLAFARFRYLRYHFLPYLTFVIFCTISFERRCRQVWQDVMNDGINSDSLIMTASEEGIIIIDIIVYLIGIPYLFYLSYFEARLRRRDLDPDEDFQLTFDEMIFFLYKNVTSVSCLTSATCLTAVAILRISGHKGARGWNDASHSANIHRDEFRLMAWLMLVLWCSLLHMLLPFRFIGPLLMTIWKMLIGDVFKWLFVYIFILLGFSQSVYILIQDASLEHGSFLGSGFSELLTMNAPVSNFDYVVRYLYVTLGDVRQDEVEVAGSTFADVWLVHIAFIALSTILLVNLLIATMGNTHSLDISASGYLNWWMYHANIVLQMERELSEKDKISHRSGQTQREAVNGNPASAEYAYTSVGTALIQEVEGTEAKHKGLEFEVEQPWMPGMDSRRSSMRDGRIGSAESFKRLHSGSPSPSLANSPRFHSSDRDKQLSLPRKDVRPAPMHSFGVAQVSTQTRIPRETKFDSALQCIIQSSAISISPVDCIDGATQTETSGDSLHRHLTRLKKLPGASTRPRRPEP
ncbi:hypothetical protein GUITHDRAFT_105896 [Guillardia theta CCMP2712]|uniref:Ion transport domain-containing protein n=1 Tax=Guillardia theta (strain CCMP2712) TaxID=905079 RepID=L1JJQ3_GUITC|nr:hypothetical protein GUITHDRAFT_105896 [Guillardia theta CCMP2712]EKX48290.1 hypothetical protein GUITHDRAFT_105896 [Guillardia theta CCMP2712]|eukprot:XP_005835270.1 hypothetical protein GUITHDRAFT_105896 [Guillardia theta CCMP2712]